MTWTPQNGGIPLDNPLIAYQGGPPGVGGVTVLTNATGDISDHVIHYTSAQGDATAPVDGGASTIVQAQNYLEQAWDALRVQEQTTNSLIPVLFATVSVSSSPTAGVATVTPTSYVARDSVAVYPSPTTGALPTLRSETWTGSNGAAWPAQWSTTSSSVGATATIQSNRGRLATGVSGSYNDNIFVAIGGRADEEITVDVVLADVTEHFIYIIIRDDSDGNRILFELLPASNLINLVRQDSFVGATPIEVAQAFAPADIVHIRLQAIGQLIRARWWLNAASEPSTWGVAIAEPLYTTNTGVSLVLAGGAATTARTVDWDNFLLMLTSPTVSGYDATAPTTVVAAATLASATVTGYSTASATVSNATGVATATPTAYTTTSTVSQSTSLASVTVTAYTAAPITAVSAAATLATVTVTGYSATCTVSNAVSVASASGAAYSTTSTVSSSTGLASASPTAYGATTTVSTSTGLASATVSGFTATGVVTVTAAATLASVTVSGFSTTSTVVGAANLASAAATAYDATSTVSTSTGLASVAVTAYTASPINAVSAAATLATSTVTAYGTTSTISGAANAASVTATAYGTTSTVSCSTTTATVTVTAYTAAPTNSVTATATLATVTVTGYGSICQISASTSAATATVSAFGTTATVTTSANFASVTAAAYDPTVTTATTSVDVSAQLATATVSAYAAAISVSVTTQTATVTITGQSATDTIAASENLATVTVTGYTATGVTAVSAAATLATATIIATAATATVSSSSGVAATTISSGSATDTVAAQAGLATTVTATAFTTTITVQPRPAAASVASTAYTTTTTIESTTTTATATVTAGTALPSLSVYASTGSVTITATNNTATIDTSMGVAAPLSVSYNAAGTSTFMTDAATVTVSAGANNVAIDANTDVSTVLVETYTISIEGFTYTLAEEPLPAVVEAYDPAPTSNSVRIVGVEDTAVIVGTYEAAVELTIYAGASVLEEITAYDAFLFSTPTFASDTEVAELSVQAYDATAPDHIDATLQPQLAQSDTVAYNPGGGVDLVVLAAATATVSGIDADTGIGADGSLVTAEAYSPSIEIGATVIDAAYATSAEYVTFVDTANRTTIQPDGAFVVLFTGTATTENSASVQVAQVTILGYPRQGLDMVVAEGFAIAMTAHGSLESNPLAPFATILGHNARILGGRRHVATQIIGAVNVVEIISSIDATSVIGSVETTSIIGAEEPDENIGTVEPRVAIIPFE